MDVNSRDPSQNIIPFRIKGVEVARFDISGNLGIGTSAPSANLDVVGTVKINGDLYVNGTPLTSLTSGVVVNMDSQPAPVTALNRQKKQSIPLAAASTLSTSDIIAKMSGVSVGKTQVYGVGPAQMASYGNIVVAVGSGTNSIAYSLANPPTAASWVGIPNSAATFTTQGFNIAYANGTWVAAGEGTNSIAYSTTTPPVASSWVGIPSGTSINGVVNTFSTRGLNIAYGNGAWVAGGSGTNSIAYSLANPPTAESWVGIPLSFSPTVFNNDVDGITFGNGTWVATGTGTNGIAYSTRTPPTADSWVVVPLTNVNDAGSVNTFGTVGINVTFANGVWLASGQGTNTLCYSIENPPIAGSWMPITTGVLFGNTGRSIAYGNGTWVACGNSGTLLAYSTSRIPHSSSWVAMKGPTPSSSGEIINNITFNPATNTWYFLGDIGSNCMFYSTATPPVPATWIGVQRSAGAFTTQALGAVGITTPAFTAPINVARLDNKVTFPANRMIAVGGGGAEVIARSANTPTPATTGTISYSDDDGATWAMVPGGATNSMFSSAADIAAGTTFGVGGSRGANAVAWNGEKWVAAGNGRTHSLAFSDDGGMTWTGITGKSVFSVEARDVAWNGRMWVAVGRGINFSTAYSYDGVTWMGPVTDDVSGTTINVFSFDIAGPSAAMSDISGGGNHVIWTGKMWVATGTRTLIAGSSPPAYYTVAYSMDGKSWTGVPESGATNTGFDIYAHGIAWNGRNFIATGRGTVNTLAFFTDASVTTTPAMWQGLGNTVFSVWGRGITWGARRWMATGRGTNTVAYSTNGRNWQGCGANVFKPMRRFMAMGDTGLYTPASGAPQRGVAFSYSDDGITWDAPIVNQSVEFSTPLGGATDTTRSVIFANNNTLLTNVITDIASAHTGLMYSTDAGASWARVPGTSDAEANGGTGMTVANNGSYSLAMNPARTRFLVGGGDTASATRKVYFSNDGFNWRNGISSPNSSLFAWVSAALWVGGGYNRWLIGGSDATTNTSGRIMYSGDADAVAPWVASSPTLYSGGVISCFAANTDFSVILAGIYAPSGDAIHRSVNGGANWTATTSTLIGGVRSIAFSPSLGRWVAVGGGGGVNTIMYSNDATGTAWTVPPQGGRGGAGSLFKIGSEVTRVIWDAVGGRFLIGGWNGQSGLTSLTNVFGLDATTNNNPGYTMAYSADGINWTPVTVRTSDDAGAPPPDSTSGTIFGPFLTRCREIMALDMSGDFTPINTGYTVSWNSYANRFVATGNGTTPVVYSSDGGATWTPANQQPPQQAIAVAGGLGGTSGSTTTVSPITYTIDGKTWSQGIGAKEIFGTGGTVLAIKYGQTSTAISPNGRIWVAGGTPAGAGTSSLAFSQNGVRWTAITGGTTMSTNIRAITYAPPTETTATTTASSGIGNGVWVAGGNGVNSLVFSYDGISWSEVPNSLTILSQCNACAFGAGVFVAGGIATTGSTAIDTTANMAYSTDGLNWQPIRGSSARIASGTNISCITYGRDETGRGLWVAGAFGSTTISILYSYNGIDWTGVAGSGTSLSSNVTGLAYGVNARTGQGLWVASVYSQTSAGYSFLFSANGRDGWTTVPNTKTGLFEVNTSGATGISYLNSVWYATGLSAGVSTGRTLAYSYEGSSGWFGVYPTTNIYGTAVTTFSATDMRCVATSTDYAIPMTTTTATALAPVRGLGWTAGTGSAYIQHPTLLFGGGDSSRATANSADGGRSWGSSTVSISRSAFRGGVCNDAFWNGAIWAAVGYDAVTGAKVATSKDGVTWTQIPAGSVPIAGILYSIMWNGSVWMVGGDGSPTNDANTVSIAWSPDLATWFGIANTDTKLRIVKRIAWNGMYWVAVGAGDVSTIMHSVDKNGLKWEDTYLSSNIANKTASITTVVNDIVWGGGRWVAVGRGNSVIGGGGVSIIYSADTPEVVGVGAAVAEYAIKGRRWTGVASSAQLFPYGANSVCWNGKRFVATGPASATCSTGNIIAWSADGISWNAYSSAKTVAPGQRWVAVGSGSRACIALSADGRVWTDVSGSALLFSDISGASATLVSTMKTGARAIGWNANSLVVGGARSATTVTATSQLTATATTGRTTIPVCAFIGSGNGVMGGGTTNVPDASFQSLTMRASSSVFITHMDVNTRDASAPWANMWLNTYTDLSGTQLFQVTPETQTFSSALKWNGWSWVANFGMTTTNPSTGEQYGSIWYCTDPLARVGWSVASNNAPPRILMGQGGYAALEWNGVAWLACGYDPNNNNLIYTTDRYGATGWTSVSGIVSGGSAAFQPVCIASSPRFWVVGGSLGAATSAMYYTSDRTGATGWRAIMTSGLPGIRITSVGYNGAAWVCCGGGGGGTGAPTSSISWRADTGTSDIGAGWSAASFLGTNGSIPPIMSRSSAIAYNAGAGTPIWVVVGDVSGNVSGDQIAYTTDITGASEWKKPTSGTLTNPTYGRLNGIAWTGYSWIATSGAGSSRIASTTDITAAQLWNNATHVMITPTLCTNAVAYVNIPISLLTTGMPTSAGSGAGTGAMWRGGVGRAQGLLPGGGADTTSVIVRSANGAEGARWSQVYSRNFLIAVGGGVIRDASGVGGANRMAYSYDGGISWTTNNSAALTTAALNSIGSIRTVKYGNGMWVAGGDSAGSSASGGNCLAWSRDGVNWTGAGGTQIFGSAGACYAVCCNDRGRWVAVGGAALGTAGTYTNTSGAIYTMAWSDDGMNWTPILGLRALFGIVCQGVSYGADASGVGMWMAIGRGGAYTGCAYSYDAKNWYLSQTSGSLFGTSANVLTERYAPVASLNWRRVSLSSTGQYQTAVVENNNIYTSSDYGVSWIMRTTGATRTWFSVSLSSTGQYQTAVVNAGNIWTSLDYGVNWIERPTGATRGWFSVSLSSTGQYQTAVVQGGNIWTSSDYGVNWTERTTGATRTWYSVSLSSTGQYQTAVAYEGNIWTSSDYGVNWTERTTGTPSSTRTWVSVSLSSTGQYQTAVVNGGNIWTSSDYGVNWTERTTGAIRYWVLVSISSTGQYQTAVAYGGNIWTSSDYGVNWIERTTGATRNWFSVSLSSTGQYQTAVVNGGLIYISSNFGETWSSGATDSRSLGVAYGKDASGVGMWVTTAGRRDRDVAASVANTMAYSYDGKLWRGITAAAGLSEQAWSVAYGKDGFGVGMWVCAGYDVTCGLKWSYDGVSWNATMGASGAAVWAGMAAGRRALSVYWNGSMWLASTSDTRNGEPRGTGIAANNASGVPGYLLYSYNGKNWLPVLAPNTYAATVSASAQPSVYSVLPNPAILDFGSFYDDQAQRGTTIANTTARTVGAVMSGGVPIENINTIVPYGRGSLTTGQVPFLMGGDSGLVDSGAGAPGTSGLPITSELAATTTSLSTSTDGGITWRAVPNSTKVMTKVNKILCDETTQQIVAVGAGNYSVATSTLAKAADADGWTGVFGSRMTDTRAGLFEKYGTAASWFGGAKMWIASGRAQSRRGSSLAVSVNGTVWQDAKIVSQVAAGMAGTGRGGGMVSRTTGDRTTIYTFTTFTFDNAGATGREGPELATVRTAYTNRGATWPATYLNMTTRGIQEWMVPATGSYTIRAVGAGGGGGIDVGIHGRGRDISLTTTLTRGEIIRILVGQMGVRNGTFLQGSGGGGTFVIRGTQTPIIVAGGGGGIGYSNQNHILNNSSGTTSGNNAPGTNGTNGVAGGTNGSGGNAGDDGGGGGFFGNGGGEGGFSFINGGLGGTGASGESTNGGFGGGGGANLAEGGGGGGGYSGGGGGGGGGSSLGGGGGGSFGITTLTDAGAINTGNGYVTITFTTTPPLTFNSSVVPYTASTTHLLTYTDSAAAFSTQVGGIATNSQYNRAVVGGSGVQFVAGGRGGIAVSNDGQNWSAAASTVFQTPTNVAAYSTATGSGGFDASFGTVALTQRLTTPATYFTGSWFSISLSSTGQYQSAVINSGGSGEAFIYTSSDYGISWTQRTQFTGAWISISLSATGQYQSAVNYNGGSGAFIYTSSDYGVSWTQRTQFTGFWLSISLSTTGQYQSAVIYPGGGGQFIYTSSDYGVSWTQRTQFSGGWYSISLSSSGQYQSAVINSGSGNIYTSSDYGVSWTQRTQFTGTWVSISLSATGQYQSAVINSAGAHIYTSSDYGISWTRRTQFTGNWVSISLSATGQYQSAVIGSSGAHIYTSSDYGVSWTQRTQFTGGWYSISLSSSGQYQSAVVFGGHICTSTDFGVTWVQRSTATKTNAFTRIKSSASGQYQIATSGPAGNTNGQLYVSSDYGQSWIPRRGRGTWLGGAVSATGAVMMGAVLIIPILPNAFYVRTGTSNWRDFIPLLTANTTTDLQTWGSFDALDSQFYIDSAPNDIAKQFSYFAGYWLNFNKATIGQSFSVPTYGSPASGFLGIFTFTATSTYPVSSYTGSLTGYNNNAIYPLPSQTDGNTAGRNAGNTAGSNAVLNLLIRSTDFGTTFSDVPGTTLALPAYWRAISVSNSATVQTAVAYGGSIYRSLDTGATWSNTGITLDGNASANTATPRNWQDIAVSAETGAVQVTCVSGGYLYLSTNTGASWNSSAVSIDGAGTQTTNRAWQAVAVSANGQYGLACVNSTTAAGFLYRSTNSGASWASANIIIDGVGTQTTNRSWQDVGMSANGKYQVACISTPNIFYSKDYGASWFILTAAGSRNWSSVAISENGSTISATTNDSTGGVWVYAMPDEQYYRSPALLNSGSTTTPATVRAITYGNSGTGAATDGYWVAGADAAANTLAFSSNGMDWTAVVGSKTTLFNSVNGVAYGADTAGTPLWVAVGSPFVGSVPGTTAFSIAYSYNMNQWTGVRNAANFTGQGNHVAYGQDEFGAGVWVAVGQSDGVLAANLGDSSLYNSNGTPNTTIFYSYDGANWAAGTGAGVFAVSGTDVSWGVDASGVGTWVATGIGFTDPTTGAVIAGGQVAHSVNGRGWAPIRAPTSIVPAMTPATIPATERRNVIPPPPTSTGFAASLYTDIWRMLGGDIDGEAANDQSGWRVALSADGTTLAIGARYANADDSGHVRVYKYNPNKTTTPVGWEQLGADIDGEAASDQSGYSVALSADGTTLAIGAVLNDGAGLNNVGHVRVYKYNPNKTVAQTNQSLAGFGPVGWDRLGEDIDGEALDDQSGTSVALSADGTTLAIGARYANTPAGTNDVGHVRVYKYNPNKTPAAGWDRLGEDIDGEALNDQSGTSVALSADGTTLAIGAPYANTNDSGHVRVYKYNQNKVTIPVGWDQLGADIDGEALNDQSGTSVALSADGTTLAIGALYNDGTTGNSNDIRGHVRVYKYNPNKITTPVGWDQLGADIDGEATGDQSGWSVALSADGTTLAIGAVGANTPAGTSDVGHVRVYKYNPNKITTPVGWDQLGVDIDGELADDLSGYSVALSADGTTLAIGAPYANADDSGHVRVYKLITAQVPATFTISNPAIADIENGGFIVIKSSGSATITAVQPATPPFTFAPVIVQGTLTVSGSVYTLVYDTFYPIFTPFPGAVAGNTITVAYGRAGSQGAGAPLWIVGGAGSSNVFARSSLPTATTTTTSAWSVVANTAPLTNAPFAVCNSIGYSNGVWVAGNNTDATNVLARSTDGGTTWTPVTASSVSGIIAGAAAVGTNAFCNYSLAVADYSNDTNLRSWVAVQGTKNFFFEGGVSAVATVTPNIVASTYNSSGGNTRAWWVAGGVGLSGVASLGYTTDPSGATGWTKSASSAIANLATVNAVAFSPHTQRWIAVGAGPAGSLGTNILTSDASGATWTSSAVATALTPVITLNACVWNQLPAAASAAGRWLAGGTRNNGGGVTIPNSASIYISTDVSGSASPWTPVTGTGAILLQVYSLAYNGTVWFAAGVPAADNGSTSTLMRTTDPAGATGWQGITATNASTGGFDTTARSITWNADQQMWVATGENTGGATDAAFSSVIYSQDINGAVGTWRTVRESNSLCFSGEGTGLAFTGDKWFASGEGTRQIVATTGTAANATGTTAASWAPVVHGTALTRASDIAYTGRRLIASGAGSGATNGIILSSDNTGTSWTPAPAGTSPGFTDTSGGGTSVNFEASYEGVGRVIATGRSATNALSVSVDGGTTWTAPSTQFSSVNTVDAATTPLFTTGGNSVAYVGNDTLFAVGGNDVHWTGKRWVAVGVNSGAAAATTTTTATTTTPLLEIYNNNTTPVATSDDGITWQGVRTSQAPNLSDGTFVATNARIGATPLINSQITIADGGDTAEPVSATDYAGGIGTGIAQIDIIAELTPVSHAAFSVSSGTVGIIGAAGNGGVNSVGNAQNASFDTTAFTITTRPM